MKLFYRTYGQGKPMIILHGLFEMSDTWVGYARHWSEYFQVILPDMRNHGLSPHSNEHNSQVMADDLLELIQELGLKNLIVIGYSMGGRVAMNFTQRFGYLVRKQIIIDMAPDRYSPENLLGEDSYLLKMNQILNIDLSKYRSRQEILAEARRIIGNSRLSGLIMKNLKSANGKFTWKFNPQALKNYINRLGDYPIEINKKITTPTLVIRAENSPYVGPKQIELIKQIFENHKIITIPNTTHFMQVERPEQVLKAIDDFLGLARDKSPV